MTSTPRHTEAAFETVIEAHLLDHGYVPIAREGFDRERAIFPETVLAFIRKTQPKEWSKLEALHGEKTDAQILGDLCKWIDQNGSLATLRHGFKCYGRTLHAAYFKAAHELNPEVEVRYAANRLTGKRYESRKSAMGDSWSHDEITLRPINPTFPAIVISEKDGERLAVVAELIEVLRP